MKGGGKHTLKRPFLRFSHATICVNTLSTVSQSCFTGLCTVKIRYCENKTGALHKYVMFQFTFHMGKKEDLSVHETLEQTQRSGHVPCPQSFPTSWHSAGLGINRRACCAPRMHVCRVPISEYTVIGLPEGPYLTFRLQVAGHSIAHPSSASAINPFLARFSRHKQKQRQIKSPKDYVI